MKFLRVHECLFVNYISRHIDSQLQISRDKPPRKTALMLYSDHDCHGINQRPAL